MRGLLAAVTAGAVTAGLVLVVTLTACSSVSGVASGLPCTTSAECQAGLICDITSSPPICAGTILHIRDLSTSDQRAADMPEVAADMAGEDLAGADLSAVVVDMTTVVIPPDLSAHDGS